jgi:hypothetical protein
MSFSYGGREGSHEKHIAFPRFGLRARGVRALKYRVLGRLVGYYRGKAAMADLPLPLGQALRRAVSSCDGRILYVKNPKAACSSLTQLVHRLDRGDFVPLHRLHGASGIRQGVRYAEAHLHSLGDPNCFRFTFVRDPVARTVSAFMMLFGGKPSQVFDTRERLKQASAQEQGMWTLGYDPDGDVHRNFEVFIEYLEHCLAVAPAEVNIHWKPQTLSIARGYIDYAHIGRVETLKRDLRIIREMSGRDLLEGLDGVPHFNGSSTARSKQFTVSQAQRRKIRALYADDCAAFGY